MGSGLWALGPGHVVCTIIPKLGSLESARTTKEDPVSQSKQTKQEAGHQVCSLKASDLTLPPSYTERHEDLNEQAWLLKGQAHRRFSAPTQIPLPLLLDPIPKPWDHV